LNRQRLITIFLFILLLGAGLAAGLLYGHIQLKKERAIFAQQLKEENRKRQLLHKRYKEEKNRVAQLTRAKSALEAKNRKAQEELKDLKAQVEELSKGGEKCKATIDAYKQRVEALREKYARLVDITKKREAQYKDLILKCRQEKRKLSQELAATQADLKMMRTKFQDCAKKNLRLCEIAYELVDKYEKKGVVKSMLAQEPLTQIEKVEIEHLVQEYQDEIDRTRVDVKVVDGQADGSGKIQTGEVVTVGAPSQAGKAEGKTVKEDQKASRE